MKSNALRFIRGFGKVIFPVCLLLALSACGGDTNAGGGAPAPTETEPPPPPPPPVDPSAITKALEMGDQWLYELSGTATVRYFRLETVEDLSGHLVTKLGGTVPNLDGPSAEGLTSWVAMDADNERILDSWFTDYITQDSDFSVLSHGGDNGLGVAPGWLAPATIMLGTLRVGDMWTAHGNDYEVMERKSVMVGLDSYDAFRIVSTDTQWFSYTANVVETRWYVPVLAASLTVEQEVTDIVGLSFEFANITRLSLTQTLVELCFADDTFCPPPPE